MRIAIVAAPHIPVPPPQYGGSEQVIFYLIKGLKELGHQPVLIGTGDSAVDCPIIPISPKGVGFPQTSADKPFFAKIHEELDAKTAEIIRGVQHKVDLIHSHGYDLKQFAHIPNLTTLHCKIEFGNIPYYRDRNELHYVSISKNQQLSHPGLNYLDVVYNGEDPSQFPVVTNPEDYVCFLGRFDREKSPHMAIQLALAAGIKIKLAGKIDYLGEGYFDQEVAKYFDHPLVEYLGELGFKDKVKLLANAKCNLHPIDFREPFGLTVLEAAYCGTPTLAVSRGSMPELIEDGRTGKLVEDYIEGFHYLKDCFEMDRQYIASRARQLFNYKTMTKGYISTYRKVLTKYGYFHQADALKRSVSSKRTSLLPRIWGRRKSASSS